MMKYFTIKELCRSTTAAANGVDNTPTKDIESKLRRLVEKLLDPVRDRWGRAITVNSGYRCEKLNKLVRGAKSSQHMSGEAVDITTGTREDNKKLFDMIRDSGLEFDQLIDESKYAWIHISYREGKNRRQILHL